MRTFPALLGMSVAMAAAANQTAPGADVLVEDYAFQPPTVRIPMGGSVTWTLGADPEQHTVTPVAPAPFEDSGNLFSGDTFEVTFEQAGSWEYLCTLHPTMRGRVIVLAAATSSPEASLIATPPAAVSPSSSDATVAPAVTNLPEPDTPTVRGAAWALPLGVLLAIAALGLVVVVRIRRTRGT